MNRRMDSGGSMLTKPLIIGSLTGVATILAAMLLCAAMFMIADMSESAALPMASVAAGTGALVGGYICARMMGKQGIISGVAVGAVLFVITFMVSLFVSPGGVTLLTPLRLVIMLLSSAIGGVLGVNTGTKRKMI